METYFSVRNYFHQNILRIALIHVFFKILRKFYLIKSTEELLFFTMIYFAN